MKLWRLSLFGCGAVIIFAAAAAIWLGVQVFSNPPEVEITAHHPFRSAEAKERYLRLYESREKHWPVAWESRMVDTSYGETFVRMSGPTDAPPLVLLPGANATSLLWKTNVVTGSRDPSFSQSLLQKVAPIETKE